MDNSGGQRRVFQFKEESRMFRRSKKASAVTGGEGSSSSAPEKKASSPSGKKMAKQVSEELLDSNSETWLHEKLTILVFGASGDLAKKKTYPAIFDLHRANALAKDTLVIGYARSKKEDHELHGQLRSYLLKKGTEEEVERFFDICKYRSGQYDGVEDFRRVADELEVLHGLEEGEKENRAFYFAIPPSQFLNTAATVHKSGLSKRGWNRLIVEKPFGTDAASAEKLGKDIGALFEEKDLFRIDHYLGKEMVQNIVTLRFSNAWLEPIFNRDHVAAVIITFKEDFGTHGRGGYFDNVGIIRDVMQNHLMQLLSVLCMEPPVKVAGHEDGVDYAKFVRDEKVKVLQAIEPWKLEDMVIGQYEGNGKEPGYLDDETVPKGSKQATYAAVKFGINNRRWSGVPFIMKAGKALDEKKVEVRVQFKDPSGAMSMFDEDGIPRNELVLKLQPSESIYMKMNVKKPGLYTTMLQTELDLSYDERLQSPIPDAYTRLVLDVLRNKAATFVRQDELMAAWRIVDPVIKQIESGKKAPIKYKFGSRGPVEADQLVESTGYIRNPEYAERYKSWKAKQEAKQEANC